MVLILGNLLKIRKFPLLQFFVNISPLMGQKSLPQTWIKSPECMFLAEEKASNLTQVSCNRFN